MNNHFTTVLVLPGEPLPRPEQPKPPGHPTPQPGEPLPKPSEPPYPTPPYDPTQPTPPVPQPIPVPPGEEPPGPNQPIRSFERSTQSDALRHPLSYTNHPGNQEITVWRKLCQQYQLGNALPNLNHPNATSRAANF